MWELKDIVVVLVAILGGGGIAALLRSIGQNRVDFRNQLTQEQISFRADMRAEIARLDAKLADSERRNDLLEATQHEHIGQISALQQQNKEQAIQIERLVVQNAKQADQISQQAAVIDQLTGEKAQAVNDAQKAIAARDFLERENGELRRECERLRIKLPPRAEVQP